MQCIYVVTKQIIFAVEEEDFEQGEAPLAVILERQKLTLRPFPRVSRRKGMPHLFVLKEGRSSYLRGKPIIKTTQ